MKENNAIQEDVKNKNSECKHLDDKICAVREFYDEVIYKQSREIQSLKDEIESQKFYLKDTEESKAQLMSAIREVKSQANSFAERKYVEELMYRKQESFLFSMSRIKEELKQQNQYAKELKKDFCSISTSLPYLEGQMKGVKEETILLNKKLSQL